MDSLSLIAPSRPLLKTRTPRSMKISPLRVSCTSNHYPNPIKTTASAAIILAATSAAFFSGRLLFAPPERADPIQETEIQPEPDTNSVEFSPETVESLKTLVYQKLEEGEDSQALTILRRLISYQPLETEWKFLAARILNEMGEPIESRKLYEEISSIDPHSFEALFENAVLMDRCGEGEAVIKRLEQALEQQSRRIMRNL